MNEPRKSIDLSVTVEGVDTARVNALIQSANLVGTRVVSITAHATEETLIPKVVPGHASVTLAFHGRVGDPSKGGAAFMVTVSIGMKEEPTPEDPTFLLAVVRALVYSDIPEASDEELMVFGQQVVLLNAWPMLRADIMDVAARLGVGPLVLPLMKAVPRETPRPPEE